MDEIVNKVAQSGIITLDPEDYIKGKDFVVLSISEFMEDEILKEKPFREKLLQTQWEKFRDKYVCVWNDTDIVIPLWAYMLIGQYLSDIATDVFFGRMAEFKEKIILEAFRNDLGLGKFTDARVVLKGCGKEKLSPLIYLTFAFELRKKVRILMFGEPCSTVPIFKRK